MAISRVLFLCTGNYYRSRLAEHLFNWLADQNSLPWRADSRGLQVGKWGNIGPISQHVVEALKLRGISINGDHRHPQPLTLSDLADSDLVVAVKKAEHRAMMAEQFPLWTDQVEYWHVDDLDCAEPDEALPVLEENVRALVSRLNETTDEDSGDRNERAA